uniref:Uncharacterized protein n=1 Tax=Rhizophora mucronata TaxID=61149 RepID=A0A2P2MC64_RHIMU
MKLLVKISFASSKFLCNFYICLCLFIHRVITLLDNFIYFFFQVSQFLIWACRFWSRQFDPAYK